MPSLFQIVPHQLVPEYHAAGLLWYDFRPTELVPAPGMDGQYILPDTAYQEFPRLTTARNWAEEGPQCSLAYSFYLRIEE